MNLILGIYIGDRLYKWRRRIHTCNPLALQPKCQIPSCTMLDIENS
jgi:xanthosine utilization system XapX-like protein